MAFVDDVMAAVESLMRARLRLTSFSTGGGGAQVEHFQDDPPTRPNRSTALETVTRYAAETEEEFSAADEEHTPALVTVAALRSAIELESSHYSEQSDTRRSPVSVWMDLLERAETRLTARLAPTVDEGPDDGGPGVDAKWSFGPSHTVWVEGAEGVLLPTPRSSRRRVW